MLFDEELRTGAAFPADAVRFGTARTRALLDALGSPDLKLRIVHIAGTNGKGSVCAALSSVLRAAGCRTGAFLSPAVLDESETVTVDGETVPDRERERLAAVVSAAADKMSDSPTAFERAVALAFLTFAQAGCDYAVVECGLGGREDATNAVRGKELAVIAPVALDHARELGRTLADIARAKAGIIAGRAVSAPQAPEAAAVIYPLCTAVAHAPENVRVSATGTRFVYDGKEMFFPLVGAHQAANAALVTEAVKALRAGGADISDEALAEGLRNTVHHARFEVLTADNIAKSPYDITIPQGKSLILDGAHNPHGAKALADALSEVFGESGVAAVFGVLADKDAEGIAEALAPRFCKVLTVTPRSPRALAADKAEEIFDRAASKAGKSLATGTARGVKEGAERLLAECDTVVVCGSLTLFCELAGAGRERTKQRLRD